MIEITDFLLLAILLVLTVGVFEHSPTASRLRRKPKSLIQKMKHKFFNKE